MSSRCLRSVVPRTSPQAPNKLTFDETDDETDPTSARGTTVPGNEARMTRRQLFTGSARLAGPAASWRAFCGVLNPSSGEQPVRISVDTRRALGMIPSDFTGLGYEISSGARKNLLTANNRIYVQLYSNRISSLSIIRQRFDSDRAQQALSAFQLLSIGLGFRAIPALGSCARQFEPDGFRFPRQIAGCAF
jgi:hypothetical protein